ncbi:alpha/beta hydrolase [Pseudobacteriovorax antillogorgiicola]|uniref:Alpha/beta hydrolase family protein n=1 Tax=Pseudobacteriovorax antillogorgiicola TaxID=1513793 RepID=A0A1Y6CMJ3_9BACT|nr:alpha/beta hydrolase [Pseudobacteriovorax antillogorgiicola]TCS45016.1 alpha/beta hydrolase family protein [Pseudobacteriovorax antillogorgiicola]SMF76355.1 Alpha/beta hydrolase family protein [Pseudobacteriovorax antillogorgiicola]
MKTFALLCFLTFLPTFLYASVEDRSDFKVLEVEDPEAAVVIFPGAYIESGKYLALARKIQANASRPTQVYIAKFFGDFANPLQTGARIDRVLRELEDLGLSQAKTKTFLAGHSHGGIAASDTAQSKGLAGLVLMGSYLAETPLIGKDLASYPIPVLTLGGERDGLTGFSFIGREFLKSQKLDPEQRLQKPVILLPKINHMQFADGSELNDDLTALAPLDTAHRQIADVINGFMDQQLTGQLSLEAYTAQTAQALNPILKAWQDDDGTCKRSQEAVAGLSTKDWQRLNLTEKIYRNKTDYAAFVFDKSSIDDQFNLYIPTYLEASLNLVDVSQNTYLSPEVVGCKLRSQAAIITATEMSPERPASSCARLNFETLSRAYKSLTPDQKSQVLASFSADDFYLLGEMSDEGKKTRTVTSSLLKITESIKDRGDQWAIGSFPSLKKGRKGWELNTYSVETSTDAVGNFGGAFYCKVIPQSRFVEWLLLFSQR